LRHEASWLTSVSKIMKEKTVPVTEGCTHKVHMPTPLTATKHMCHKAGTGPGPGQCLAGDILSLLPRSRAKPLHCSMLVAPNKVVAERVGMA